MENYEEDIAKYPTPDKQYDSNKKYETYESLQTGAMGKAAGRPYPNLIDNAAAARKKK